MQTFSITTLGCKVNQYESDQIATLLRAHGLRQIEAGGDLRVINTCSVTVQAASKSRQMVRRVTRTSSRLFSLPVLSSLPMDDPNVSYSLAERDPCDSSRPRVIVTGCWATSDRAQAASLAGVDAVLGHDDEVAAEIHRLLAGWEAEDAQRLASSESLGVSPCTRSVLPPLESMRNDGWMNEVGTRASNVRGQVTVEYTAYNKAKRGVHVNDNLGGIPSAAPSPPGTPGRDGRGEGAISETRAPPHPNPLPRSTGGEGKVKCGTISLPQLSSRQIGHQRALLKIQDGCDAHCTYCIIPQLRPRPWSKPVDDAVAEAQRLVDAGHVEIVLTGIFLGAYGRSTALRRRQESTSGKPLGELVEALCTRVRGLRRLRLSSLEPGDLSPLLIDVLKSHSQVVPHFHLPLQSGSYRLLRRMNRQYTRDDFLRMVDAVSAAFDRPAFTTDIIVGFPGEDDREFAHTLDVVDRAKFIHIHAFSYSPRPRTAAARWTSDFVRGPVVNQRIKLLGERAAAHSFAYRRQFVGETVQLLVEQETPTPALPRSTEGGGNSIQHGRCERYFAVHFQADCLRAGDLLQVRIDRVIPHRTIGTIVPHF